MGGALENAKGAAHVKGSLAYARRDLRSDWPDGWPVVDDGLYIGKVGEVVVVYGDARMGDRTFDRQLGELSRALHASAPAPAGVLYEVGGGRALDARRRKRLIELFADTRGSWAPSVAGCTFATVSPLVRGVLQAALLLARAPVPHHVVRSTREGFAWLARWVPGLKPNAAEAEYVAALRAAKVGPFADHALRA